MCFFPKNQHTFELEIEDDVSSIRISTRTTHKHSRPSTPPSYVATMPTYVPSRLLPPSARPEDHYNIITYSTPGYTYPTPTITYGAPAAPAAPDNAATARQIAELLVDEKPPVPSYTTTVTHYNTYKYEQPPDTAREYEKATQEYLEAELKLKISEQEREQEREEVFRNRLAAPETHTRRARSVSVSSRRERSVSVSSRRERSTTRLVIEQEVRRCRDCGSERHRTRECTRNLAPVGTLVVLPAASGHRRSRSASCYREPRPESGVRYISYGDY